jgi:hypothetical protein
MSDKQHLSKDEINDLIDHKVAEAKLDIAERRLHFALWFGGAVIAVFGVILPLMQNTNSSREISSAIEKTELKSSEASAEVSKAIEKMERQFAELAGKQMLKPEITCFANGIPLERSTLTFSKTNSSYDFSIRNTGNGVATLIRVRLYLNVEDEISRKHFCGNVGNNSGWDHAKFNDKPEYKCMLQHYIYEDRDDLIAPSDEMTFSLVMNEPAELSDKIESPALLVIYYGATEPKEIPFTFRIESSPK